MSIRECAICHGPSYKEVFSLPIGYMSDGTQTNYPLIKEMCIDCGTVRTQINFDWNEFYKNEYKPSRNIDAVVVDQNDTKIRRSEFVYQWMDKLLSNVEYEPASSMLEIGCGQGYLLERFEVTEKHGVEPSKQAACMAKRVASVRNIGFEEINNHEKYDLVISYCVIEHLDKPNDLLNKCFNILNDGGIMIIALPIQDRFNYDLFFMDHLYHFSNNNFSKLLKLNGFDILVHELGRGSYMNIGLYICRKSVAQPDEKILFENNMNIQNANKILSNIDSIIGNYNELFAFGYGEVAKTIVPYTNLDYFIKYYIDDYSKADKVISSTRAKNIIKNINKEVVLLLLVNPKHEAKIKNIFNEFKNINFMSVFDGIMVE